MTPDDVLEAAARRRIKEQDDCDDPDPGIVASVKQRLKLLAGDGKELASDVWRPIADAPMGIMIEAAQPNGKGGWRRLFISITRDSPGMGPNKNPMVIFDANTGDRLEYVDEAIGWIWKYPEPLPEGE